LRTSLIGITISSFIFAVSAQAQAPSFTAASVVNAASMVSGAIAPGMEVDINGTNFGVPNFPKSCGSAVPVPTSCSSVSVLLNGTAVPVIFVSSTEVVFQVPFTLTGATATLQVTSGVSGSTLSSAVVSVPVAPVAPGLFTQNSSGSGTGYYYDSSGLVPQYSHAVTVGDTVVLYGTGFGVTNPAVVAGTLSPNPPAASVAAVTLSINSQSVPVTFAGLQPNAALGWDEVIFTVPASLTVPTGQTSATYPMVVTVGGLPTQTVNLVVGTPSPTITALTPNPVPLSANPQTVTFTGTYFQSGLTVLLYSPSGTESSISGANINVISATQFTAQITVGTSAGTWTALVFNPDGGESTLFTFTASGSAPTPIITSIVTTSSNAAQIAQNTWIEVHGTNLAAITDTWASLPASAFTNGLPTALDNVTATVDGKPAAIFYISPTQINILCPLDSATGSVAVQVNSTLGTATQNATELVTSPAFLVLDVAGHIAAEHLNYSLLGPASLNAPGYTFTPAKAGETVILYATGFGQTNPAITDESKGAGNPLPALPTVTIGGVPATVSFAGLSGAGLYQLNVIVPAGTPNGDAVVNSLYNGSPTQTTALLTIQN
jgi:uncharacterized protein (TIGR03437 family)